MRHCICGPILALVASACTSVTTGNDQTILILSEPQGAVCDLERDGALVASVSTTPMSVRVTSASGPLDITCRMAGFAPATQSVSSVTPLGSLGRQVLGGSAGRAVDQALLTDFRYPGTVLVRIDPAPPYSGPLPLAF